MYACKNKMKTVVMALLATGESKPELVTIKRDRKFLEPLLNKMNMTSFIYTANKAKTGLTAENLIDINDYLTAKETQNAGKGTTIKGTTIKGTTIKGFIKGFSQGLTRRNQNKRQLKKSRKNKQ